MRREVKKEYDLTKGGILSRLLLVAVPIMGTQLMQMTYNLTDMFWLGKVGADAVAASGTAGMFMWLSAGLMLIGRMGAEIGVSQSFGRGDEAAARNFSRNAVLMAAALGFLCAVIFIAFRGPLVGFFNIREANVAQDVRQYLMVVSLALPCTFITGALTGTFNGAGNSRMPFIANALGLVCNMILDPVFIFVFDMGVAGAAWATIIAQFVVCALIAIAVYKGKSRPFAAYSVFGKPDMDAVRQMLRWSVPIGLESMLFTLLSMIISRFVSAFGASAIAINRVGSQIESLSWLIGGGYGSALTAFVGQNFGAKRFDRINKGFRISVGVMAAWGMAVTALLIFGGKFLFEVFLPDPKLTQMGAEYLLILAICQLPMCMEAISSGAFKGTGRTMAPSVISITSNALRVPLAYALSLTELGLNGIWLGVSLGAVLRGAWSFIWYIVSARRVDAKPHL